jgi:formate/nitrite transporter FocA (FNT family)
MKPSLFYLFLLIFTLFFCIEKNHAASNVTVTTPFSIDSKIDSTEEEDLFIDYSRNLAEEKRIKTMANITFILAALSLVTLGLTYIGAVILGLITFIKARDYRKRLQYLEKYDDLYEPHRKIAALSKAAFVIALLPFAIIFSVLLITIAVDGGDLNFTPLFFGTIGILTFFALERFVFRTNDIK